MAKLIFLGTSSSIPTKTRDNTSFVFSQKKLKLLIDCPGSIIQKLIKADIDFRKLQNIVITHQHPDHIYGITSLIHTQHLLNDKLNIFSNSSCIKIIKQLVELFDLKGSDYPKINYINVFGNEAFLRKEGIKFEAIKNVHTKDSFGIRISTSNKKIFYSSDTCFSSKMLKKAGRLNYLIHDCTASSGYFKKYPKLYKIHTQAKALADYLKDKPYTKLIPVHFLLLDKNEEGKIKQELKPIKSQLLIPQDFKTVFV